MTRARAIFNAITAIGAYLRERESAKMRESKEVLMDMLRNEYNDEIWAEIIAEYRAESEAQNVEA